MNVFGKPLSHCFLVGRPIFIVIAFLVQGCSAINNHAVLAVTATNIGLELSQNPGTQAPQGKLGYNRSEYAYVPTNRPNTKEVLSLKEPVTIGGSDFSTDVLMELKYSGIFHSGPGGGIYQRLAVGKTAVQQVGAAVLFAKDESGKLDPEAAKAIAKATANTDKTAPSSLSVTKKQRKITKCYNNIKKDDAKKNTFDEALESQQFESIQDFSNKTPKPTKEQMDAIIKKLKAICDF